MSGEPELEALRQRAAAIAESIVRGETDPYRGAKRLWLMEAELATLETDLRLFAGLASEWEDAPDRRSEYERDIVAAADRFHSRWGP